jgi:hypothetical protein
LKEDYVEFRPTRDSKEYEQSKNHHEKTHKSLKQDRVPHQSDLNIPHRQRKQSDENSEECDSPIGEENDNVTDGERTIGQQRAEIVRFEHCLKNMAELLDLTARAPRK